MCGLIPSSLFYFVVMEIDTVESIFSRDVVQRVLIRSCVSAQHCCRMMVLQLLEDVFFYHTSFPPASFIVSFSLI